MKPLMYIPVRLEVLTPVHVSSGDRLDPTSYVIRREETGTFLYMVDLMAWLEDQFADPSGDPQALAQEFARRPLPAIREKLNQEIDPRIYAINRAQVISREFYEKYVKDLGDPGSRHSLKISTHVSNAASVAPLIPGSSLKGAMRTAVIDYLDQKKGLELKRYARESKNGYRNRLDEALGNIRENVFKLLKVGDFEAPLESSLIVSAKEIGKTACKKATPKDPCEVLASRVFHSEKGHVLYGRIGMGGILSNEKRFVSTLKGTRRRFEFEFDWQGLAGLVSRFFAERFVEEYHRFYSQGPEREKTRQALLRLAKEITDPAPGEMVLRVGHYSHIECVTITNNNRGYGNTRTLVEGIYPFGWVKLTPCSPEEYREGVARKQEHDEEILGRRENLRRRKREEAQRRYEEKLRQSEGLRRRQEEEARRQAELDALSPDERDLRLLEEGRLNENQVFGLYERLGDMDAGLRLRVAKALKERWKAEGRWKKKECSKKQWPKVCYLKEILGEV